MMTKETFIAEFVEQFKNLPADYMVALHNEYCNETKYYDDLIMSTDDFDDWAIGYTPTDIVLAVFYGSYNPNEEWFQLDGCGRPVSTDNPYDFVNAHSIAEWAYEDKIDLSDYGIDINLCDDDENEE